MYEYYEYQLVHVDDRFVLSTCTSCAWIKKKKITVYAIPPTSASHKLCGGKMTRKGKYFVAVQRTRH